MNRTIPITGLRYTRVYGDDDSLSTHQGREGETVEVQQFYRDYGAVLNAKEVAEERFKEMHALGVKHGLLPEGVAPPVVDEMGLAMLDRLAAELKSVINNEHMPKAANNIWIAEMQTLIEAAEDHICRKKNLY